VSRFSAIAGHSLLILLPLLFSSRNAQAQFGFLEHTLSDTCAQAASVNAGDLDNDGDIDILVGGIGTGNTAWFENLGSKQFAEHELSATFDPRDVKVADLDGDLDMDAVAASYWSNGISWWENEGGGVMTEHLVSDTTNGAHTLDVFDADDDGDADIVCAAWDKGVVVYENDGSENFTCHTLGALVEGLSCVHGVDLDQDGDFDAISAHYNGNKVSWWENCETEHVISSSVNGAHWVDAADFDLDGDLDIICAAYNISTVFLYENDGSEHFTEREIASLGGTSWVQAVDMDNDGDSDFLLTGETADQVKWFENDGAGSFTGHLIGDDIDRAFGGWAVDLDEDGDMDALAVAIDGYKLYWYENDYEQPQIVDFSLTPICAIPGEETIVIEAEVRNLEEHNISVSVTITNEDSSQTEEITLYDDGLHSDGDADDQFWGNSFTAPEEQCFHSVDIHVEDLDTEIINSDLLSGTFTTAGPLTLDSLLVISGDVTDLQPGSMIGFDIEVLNEGAVGAVTDVEAVVTVISENSYFRGGVMVKTFALADVAAGETVTRGRSMYAVVDPAFDPADELAFRLDFYSHGSLFWTEEKSIPVQPLSVEGEPGSGIPCSWSLAEPYPNPFNASAMITFEVAQTSRTELTLHDLLGREVVTLVRGELSAGKHLINFKPEQLSSGVYFLRMKAGNGVTFSRKLVYLK